MQMQLLELLQMENKSKWHWIHKYPFQEGRWEDVKITYGNNNEARSNPAAVRKDNKLDPCAKNLKINKYGRRYNDMNNNNNNK